MTIEHWCHWYTGNYITENFWHNGMCHFIRTDSTLSTKLRSGWSIILLWYYTNWRDGRSVYMKLTILASGILRKPRKSNAILAMKTFNIWNKKTEISILLSLFVGQPGKEFCFLNPTETYWGWTKIWKSDCQGLVITIAF